MLGHVESDARVRRTKLVCTLGPAVAGRITELAAAGMDVARLNFSHGSPAQREADAAAVRDAATKLGRPLALISDLAGPKIRIGELAGGTADLVAGTSFLLSAGPAGLRGPGDSRAAGVTYEPLPSDVRVGDTILLGDGVAELRVETIAGADVRTTVVRGGTIRSRTGVAIPSDRVSVDGLTDKDRRDARAALALGSHYVAQSFVRSRDDVLALRSALGSEGPPIVAKIETRPAIERFDEILDVADAVMIARGDMGVELPYEEVPIIQKQLLRRAMERGVPAIVATQMLESMISAPRPTRAEASDVANAVFDGADAIMLSAETAIGRHPVLAAEAAVRIIDLCEARGRAYLPRPERRPGTVSGERSRVSTRAAPGGASGAEGVVVAAVALADADPTVDAIACYTRSGRTARMLAALRPGVPVIAFATDPAIVARLALVHGVVPIAAPGKEPAAAASILDAVADWLSEVDALPSGASAVLVASVDAPGSGPTLLELRQLPPG